jgi:two-component sensor histidine kinase
MTGYTRGEALGRRFAELISETSAARFEPCLSLLLRGRSCHGLQLDLVCKGGGVRHVMLDARGRLGEDRIFEQAYCVLTDITQLNSVQHRLQASLEEKEVLLRELHHRVKNNLQLISSLMSLQAQRSGRSELTDLLSTTQSRIHSIALLHDTLLEPDHLSRPDVPRYFASLVEHLRNTREPADADIRFDLDIADAPLDADRAMRCGLIINELASNSLQHAFVGRQGGRVSVGFKRQGDSWVLRVADDGQPREGAGEGAPARRGLGLELVEALTQQLCGQMEVARDRGTCVRVDFPAGRDQVKREKD